MRLVWVISVKEEALVMQYWSMNGVQAASPSLDFISHYVHMYVLSYHIVDYVINIMCAILSLATEEV